MALFFKQSRNNIWKGSVRSWRRIKKATSSNNCQTKSFLSCVSTILIIAPSTSAAFEWDNYQKFSRIFPFVCFYRTLRRNSFQETMVLASALYCFLLAAILCAPKRQIFIVRVAVVHDAKAFSPPFPLFSSLCVFRGFMR